MLRLKFRKTESESYSYIDTLVPGLTLLKTKGREALTKDIETYSLKGVDGERKLSSRFPTRTIEIEFVLKKSTMQAMYTAFWSLNSILNIEEAMWSFSDEPDVFYKGIPILASDVEDVKNGGIGVIEIHCLDPFKYSVAETTVFATDITVPDPDDESQTITIKALATNNDGGYKTYPRLDVQFADAGTSGGSIGNNADCGYVLFGKNGTNYSMQFGDDEEKDITTVTRIDRDLKKGSVWGKSTTLDLLNTSNTYPSDAVLNITSNGMGISNAGTSTSKKYHGACAYYNLSANATGDFKLSWKHAVALSKTASTAIKQCGSLEVHLIGTDNKSKYRFRLRKSNTSRQTGTVDVGVGSTLHTIDDRASLKYANVGGYKSTSGSTPRWSENYISRTQLDNGTYKIVFKTVWGTYTMYADDCPAISKIAIFFGKYQTNASFNIRRVGWVKFVDGNFDAVNSFSSNDFLSIDVGNMTATLNDADAAHLGDIGNDWENMFLDVGQNAIICQYSDWVVSGYEPTFAMKYRKRWI